MSVRSLGLALPLLVCTWGWAQSSAPAGSADAEEVEVEEVEVVEVVEVGEVEEVGAAEGDPGFSLAKILGRLHPAAVHIPIGWILLLTLWELALSGRRELEPAGLYIGIGAFASLLPAVVTGLLRAGELPPDPDIVVHRNTMFAVAGVLLAAVVLRLLRRHTERARFVYLGLLIVATALVGIGGHLGGKLVYGDQFLPF